MLYCMLINKASIEHVSGQINTGLDNKQEWLNIIMISLNVKKVYGFSSLPVTYKQYHTKVKDKLKNNRKRKRI